MRRTELGFYSSVAIVISSMIGAGVYTTSGFAIADLQNRFAVLLAWVVAGIISLCGAIGYGRLAQIIRESGGEYVYLSRVLHPVAGTIAGVISLLAGFTGALALAAETFEAYLGSVLPVPEIPLNCIAVIAILLGSGLHLKSAREGAVVQTVIVFTKLLMLMGLIGIGLYSMARVEQPAVVEQPFKQVSLFGMASTLMWISLSYCGFNAAIYCAGEVKDQKRQVPRSLIWGTLLVTVIYVSLNAVFLYAVPSEKIAGRPDVAVIVAEHIGGPTLAWWMGLVIVVSLFTSISALAMIGPRVYAQMADDGVLPGWLRFQGSSPRVGIMLQAILAILIVQISTLQEQLSYLGFTLSLSAALAVGTLLLPLKVWKQEGQAVSVKESLAAAVFVLATLLIAGLSAARHPWESLSGLATIMLGAILYALYHRQLQRSKKISVSQ